MRKAGIPSDLYSASPSKSWRKWCNAGFKLMFLENGGLDVKMGDKAARGPPPACFSISSLNLVEKIERKENIRINKIAKNEGAKHKV